MLGYFDMNGDMRVVLMRDEELSRTAHLAGILVDPRTGWRHRELYPLHVLVDDDRSGGAIAAYGQDNQQTVYISARVAHQIQEEGGVCISVGKRSVDVRRVSSDEASLFATL